jgi:hypothetical protein
MIRMLLKCSFVEASFPQQSIPPHQQKLSQQFKKQNPPISGDFGSAYLL